MYQVTVSDLAFFKQQQWTVTYYCLLLYGAVVGLSTQLKNKGALLSSILIVGIVLTVIFGCHLLSKFEHSIDVRKDRLKAIRGKFSREFSAAWAAREKEEDYRSVLVVMLLMVLGSGGIAICSIFLLSKGV